MDATCLTKTVSFKDLIDKKDVSVTGCGTYLIGLSTKGDVAIETTDDDLCMILLTLTLQENGGCTLSPANTDLVCYMNSSEEPLSAETHLIDGAKLEVADKKLMFIDGPIPKRRRKLPPTPGLAFGDPPTKPTRNSSTSSTGKTETKGSSESRSAADATVPKTHDDKVEAEEESADKRWLETSWCMLDLADSEQNLFRNLQTPEQISILSASYFAKQLRMFTDATITPKLLDDVFKLFMDTIEYCRDIYMNYLSDISQALAKVPDRSNTRPMHGPAVRFLTELLKQCIDPVERVILILDLLRTFSHFDNNLVTMVRYQTTAAVLGSISAYLDVVEVQQCGVDILAKIATYKPTLDKKAPLREAGLDLAIRSVKYHNTNLSLSRSVCRMLANLASTLINVLNSWLDTESPADSNVANIIEQCENLLEYVFKEGIPVIQLIMKNFGRDLGVNTEGRKFIFYYAKLPQLQLKKSKWSKMLDEKTEEGDQETESIHEQIGDTYDNVSVSQTISQNQLLSGEVKTEEPQSILKRVGSYENLKSSEKRLVFADDTVGGSDTETTYSSVSEDDFEQSVTASVAVPSEIDGDFSSNVVQHLVRKTIKRRKRSVTDSSEAGVSDSESESEFLQSLSVTQKRDETDSPVQNVSAGASGVERQNGKTKNNNSCADDSMMRQISKTDVNETHLTDNGYEVVRYEDEKENVSTDMSENRVNEIVNDKSDFPVKHKNSQDAGNGNSKITNNEAPSQSERESHFKDDMGKSAVIDVTFLGKLVRTQIVVYVGSLVFRGEDSMVLMVIDKPIPNLLEDASAPQGLVEFATSQYGTNMTLMDLEPAIVISVIDAVRYRSVTKDLVQSAVLSLTRTMNEKLQTATLNTAMLFFKAMFSDEHLRPILTDEEFLKEFRPCFHNATERMEKSHNVEDLRKNLTAQCV
ncbi:uncharacterized protein LOC123528642 [Mercenaria mercenaria]|uniref:uncharacterized protein LOC123528642 n=1 Tax=Mercenaria mercenaria TaxID=6596 RepID=UPI00234F8F90|nr:uncharacterized protein LOC123528642 [Mercenaria mercenaria]